VRKAAFRTRLLLWYVGIMGVILVGFVSVLYVVLTDQLNRETNRRLQAVANVVAQASLSPTYSRHSLDFDTILEHAMGFQPSGKFIQVLDRAGQVGIKSTNLRTHQLPVTRVSFQSALAGESTFESFEDFQGRPFRILTWPVVQGGRVVHVLQIGTSLDEIRTATGKIGTILFASIPLLLLFAGIGGWLITGRFIAPIARITSTAGELTAETLNRRIDYQGPDDEMGKLVSTFNGMVERLNTSFSTLKRFSADVSHELRTPLTIMKGEVDLALRRERGGEEYREALGSVREEIDRLSAVIDDVLTLARSDLGTQAMETRPIELCELIGSVVAKLAPLGESRGVKVHRCSRESLAISGDPGRMERLLANLLDNAIKYTPSGGDVFVDCRESRGHAVVTVRDTGPGIPPEHRDRVFDRFYRVPGSGPQGTGLGLSIASWIARIHGGWIEIVDPPGGGTQVDVWLPLGKEKGQ
jgi:heavy metal sensor kinase